MMVDPTSGMSVVGGLSGGMGDGVVSGSER